MSAENEPYSSHYLVNDMLTQGAVVNENDSTGAPDESTGLPIISHGSSPIEEPFGSGAGARADGRALAEFVAELFAILHPATLPMLERMFAEAREDAEIDGELGMKWHAEIGLAAARIALLEQQAIDS